MHAALDAHTALALVHPTEHRLSLIEYLTVQKNRCYTYETALFSDIIKSFGVLPTELVTVTCVLHRPVAILVVSQVKILPNTALIYQPPTCDRKARTQYWSPAAVPWVASVWRHPSPAAVRSAS